MNNQSDFTVKWTPLSVMQFGIAVFCITSVMVITVLSYFIEPPAANASRLDTITGALLTVGFASIVTFLYGQKEQAAQLLAANKQANDNAQQTAALVAASTPIQVTTPQVTTTGSPVTIVEQSNDPGITNSVEGSTDRSPVPPWSGPTT